MAFKQLYSILQEKLKNDPKGMKVLQEKIKEQTPPDQLAKFFNVTLDPIQFPMNESKLFAAHELINEAYEKLSPMEREYVGIMASNNKVRVFRQIKMLETLIPGIKSAKEREMVLECLDTLKGDIVKRKFSEAVERTLELKYTIKSLLEAGDEYHGGVITMKLGNLTYIKDARLAILHDEKDAPETLYLTFTTPFYPIGNDFSSVKASLTDLDKKYGRMGRNILNATIYKKGLAGKIFTGEGIWDGGVRINSVKPGQMSPGAGELTLHIVPGALHSPEEAKKAVIPILRDLDSLMPGWFPEVDKNAQKAYLKNPDADTSERLSNLKRTTRGEPEAERSDEFGGAF